MVSVLNPIMSFTSLRSQLGHNFYYVNQVVVVASGIKFGDKTQTGSLEFEKLILIENIYTLIRPVTL